MRPSIRSAKTTTADVVVSALGVAERLAEVHGHLADLPQDTTLGDDEARALALLGRDLITAGTRLRDLRQEAD